MDSSVGADHGMNMAQVAYLAEQWRAIQQDGQLEGDIFKLPTLAVVGEQNAGKSSVLRLIIGMNILPCDKQMCTRCPIVVSLLHDPEALAPLVKFDQDEQFEPLDELRGTHPKCR